MFTYNNEIKKILDWPDYKKRTRGSLTLTQKQRIKRKQRNKKRRKMARKSRRVNR